MIIRKIRLTEYEYQPPINYVAGATEPDIQFQLADYTIPAGATARCYVQRFDGTFEYTVATIDGNNVTVEPTSSMFSVRGEGAIQITLYAGEEVLKNFSVPVFVHADLANENAEQGSDVTGIFRAAEEQALGDFQEAAEAKAAEVIESIPADYTELTEEVDELNERLSYLQEHVYYEQVDILGQKTVSVTTGVTIGLTESQFSASIASGETFTVRVDGTNIIDRYAVYYNEGGGSNQLGASKLPNTDYSYTAPTDITRLYIYAGTSNVIGTGTLTITAKTTQYNNDSIDKKVSDLESSVSDLESSVSDLESSVIKAKQTGNIFEAKTDAISGKYYYRNGSNLALATNASYNCFIVPVLPDSQYCFTQSNIVLLDEDKKPLSGSSSWDYSSATACNSGNAKFFAVSYVISSVPSDGYCISMGNTLDYDGYNFIYYVVSAYDRRGRIGKSVSGNIASGSSLILNGKSALKDGQQIVFRGKYSSFSELEIKFVTSQNYVKITSANLVICNTTSNTITQPHGLTLSNDICVLLEIKKSEMYVSITSMGVTYTYHCSWNQTDAAITHYEAKATGMAFMEAKLSSAYSACKRDVWYFGDSYIAFGTDTRIPYYMEEYGFDKNVLFNGASGGTSSSSTKSLSTLLNYGIPSFAIMATGMNDGSDSNDTPSSSWLTNVQKFISVCETNGIEPILCTIPTVPSVNNEQKNTWVRSSGYRYIDFAKAVGANANGQWFTGMLSSDNVHPSTIGGNALFTQLIADVPEVMG